MRTAKSPLERFAIRWTHNVRTGCHEWTGYLMPNGYGQFRTGGKGSPTILAHRYSWQINRGVIPAGMLVCHHCDNRRCVNPEHLFIGSYQDNADDMIAKGRKPTGEKSYQSKLTLEQVREIRASSEVSRVIAIRYGVDPSNIRQIRRRVSWRAA